MLYFIIFTGKPFFWKKNRMDMIQLVCNYYNEIDEKFVKEWFSKTPVKQFAKWKQCIVLLPNNLVAADIIVFQKSMRCKNSILVCDYVGITTNTDGHLLSKLTNDSAHYQGDCFGSMVSRKNYFLFSIDPHDYALTTQPIEL